MNNRLESDHEQDLVRTARSELKQLRDCDLPDQMLNYLEPAAQVLNVPKTLGEPIRRYNEPSIITPTDICERSGTKLPNEVLRDVFRWFDRRFLETKLRLVSRRVDALVDLLKDKAGPMLCFDHIEFEILNGFIHFQLGTKNGIDALATTPKPFDTYDPTAVPSYLYGHHVGFYAAYSSTNVKNQANDKFVRSINKFTYNDVAFTTFTVKGPRQMRSILLSLHDRAWGKVLHEGLLEFVYYPQILSAQLYRTCAYWQPFNTTVKNIVTWSSTPIDPSDWNSETTTTKHMLIKYYDNVNDFKGVPAILLQVIVREFLNRSLPCSAHLYVTASFSIFKDQYVHQPSPIRRWTNPTTKETLCEVHKHSEMVIWCRPTDSPSDLCHNCPHSRPDNLFQFKREYI